MNLFMKYTNPVVKGFYPDPSVCSANGKYYMVCSSFQYFPGVPLFESTDLVNWTQIGYVLTKENQVMLDKVNSSGGVFAPTIRYNNGRFYMVTTNHTTQQNFYVYTDNIYSEWSDPIYVNQDGIDPSLFFENGKTYFMSNGTDDNGESGIVQCEINIANGQKLSKSKCIWKGSGGRYLESPHMYRINEYYYLMAAEGGTEYGHMITYARSQSVWGEFVGYPNNPVLTNRNKAPYIIQGIGHGDLVMDKYGEWYILSLGFRQIDLWMPYHNLGREVFLTPVKFNFDGWFTAGKDGTTAETYEIAGNFLQNEKKLYTFEDTSWKIEWCHLRRPNLKNYHFLDDRIILHGSDITLDDIDSPTFIALRQRDFQFELSVNLTLDNGEAGVTCYMCEEEHYDIALMKNDNKTNAVLKLNIGGIKHTQSIIHLKTDSACLLIRGDHHAYHFYIITENTEIYMGSGKSKYLSSEVSEGFTGVMLGLYSIGNNTALFQNFQCQYQ